MIEKITLYESATVELEAERAAHLATRQELSVALADLDEARVEVERLRKLFTDVGGDEHDVLALVELWQDAALRSDELRREVERLTRDLATSQSLLSRALGPDLDTVASTATSLDASRAEVERLRAEKDDRITAYLADYIAELAPRSRAQWVKDLNARQTATARGFWPGVEALIRDEEIRPRDGRFDVVTEKRIRSALARLRRKKAGPA